MILFHMRAYAAMAESLRLGLSWIAGQWGFRRFANDEMHLTVETDVAGRACAMLGTIAPPDDHLLEIALLAHTLKTQGASRVSAVLPYLAYTRQDKPEPGRSMAIAWVGAVLQASGADEIITVDIHSHHAQQLLPMAVRSLSSAHVFADAMLRFGWPDATLVAPDAGAIPRCTAVRQALGLEWPVVHCEKRRTEAGVHSQLAGGVGRYAVVIDDMLDTGGTLLACCAGLLRAGCEHIAVLVTHGLFTGSAWPQLYEMNVEQIICTDTVPLPDNARAEGVRVLSVTPLLMAAGMEEQQ